MAGPKIHLNMIPKFWCIKKCGVIKSLFLAQILVSCLHSESQPSSSAIFFKALVLPANCSLIVQFLRNTTRTQRQSAAHLHMLIATIRWMCPMCPLDMSRWSHRDFCQYVASHTNQFGMSSMSLTPSNRPQDTSAAYRPANSLMCLFFRCSFFCI